MHALPGWLALWIGPAALAPATEAPAVLAPGVSIERRVSVGGWHEYAIALKRGDLMHAVVEQRGIDTVEEIFDPAGRRVLRVDTARGAFGPEPLWIVADLPGTYRLRITPLFRS